MAERARCSLVMSADTTDQGRIGGCPIQRLKAQPTLQYDTVYNSCDCLKPGHTSNPQKCGFNQHLTRPVSKENQSLPTSLQKQSTRNDMHPRPLLNLRPGSAFASYLPSRGGRASPIQQKKCMMSAIECGCEESNPELLSRD